MEIVILAIMLMILGLAVVGFVSVIRWLFSSQSAPVISRDSDLAEGNSPRSLPADAQATAYILNYLLDRHAITPDQFHSSRKVLDETFGDQFELPPPLAAFRDPQFDTPWEQHPQNQPINQRSRPSGRNGVVDNRAGRFTIRRAGIAGHC